MQVPALGASSSPATRAAFPRRLVTAKRRHVASRPPRGVRSVQSTARAAPTNRAPSSFRPGSPLIFLFPLVIVFLTRLSRHLSSAAGARAMHGALAASVQRQD